MVHGAQDITIPIHSVRALVQDNVVFHELPEDTHSLQSVKDSGSPYFLLNMLQQASIMTYKKPNTTAHPPKSDRGGMLAQIRKIRKE